MPIKNRNRNKTTDLDLAFPEIEDRAGKGRAFVGPILISRMFSRPLEECELADIPYHIFIEPPNGGNRSRFRRAAYGKAKLRHIGLVWVYVPATDRWKVLPQVFDTRGRPYQDSRRRVRAKWMRCQQRDEVENAKSSIETGPETGLVIRQAPSGAQRSQKRPHTDTSSASTKRPRIRHGRCSSTTSASSTSTTSLPERYAASHSSSPISSLSNGHSTDATSVDESSQSSRSSFTSAPRPNQREEAQKVFDQAFGNAEPISKKKFRAYQRSRAESAQVCVAVVEATRRAATVEASARTNAGAQRKWKTIKDSMFGHLLDIVGKIPTRMWGEELIADLLDAVHASCSDQRRYRDQLQAICQQGLGAQDDDEDENGDGDESEDESENENGDEDEDENEDGDESEEENEDENGDEDESEDEEGETGVKEQIVIDIDDEEESEDDEEEGGDDEDESEDESQDESQDETEDEDCVEESEGESLYN